MSLAQIRKTRSNLLSLLDSVTEKELNHVPKGFNNNLIWNLGHIIASQQLLCYKLSNLPFVIDENIVDTFKNGTKIIEIYSSLDYENLKQLAQTTVDRLQADLDEKKFQTFTSFPTSYGIQLNNIEDAIRFANMHEAFHLGYVMALRRAVNQDLVENS